MKTNLTGVSSSLPLPFLLLLLLLENLVSMHPRNFGSDLYSRDHTSVRLPVRPHHRHTNVKYFNQQVNPKLWVLPRNSTVIMTSSYVSVSIENYTKMLEVTSHVHYSGNFSGRLTVEFR